MSILDDAIREHLELKRAHGADAAELKRLEDEAFGPPRRPDELEPFGEAPTEFLAAPEVGAEEERETGGRRVPNIADLQEPPQPAKEPVEPPQPEQAGEPEAPPIEAPPEAEPPAEEEHPAMEHEAIVLPPPPPQPAAEAEREPQPDAGPSAEERHAIAEQPTELFDVEAEMEPASEATSPSDEDLIDAEMSEPRLAPVDTLAGLEESEEGGAAAEPEATEEQAGEDEEEEDGFFSEQRLSDELNQALEAPITEEHAVVPATEEHEVGPATEEHALGPETDEHAAPRSEEAATPFFDQAQYGEEKEHEEDEETEAEAGGQHEDVLEDTPEFLEDAPEDDELWFEQRPPKDFDFDD